MPYHLVLIVPLGKYRKSEIVGTIMRNSLTDHLLYLRTQLNKLPPNLSYLRTINFTGDFFVLHSFIRPSHGTVASGWFVKVYSNYFCHVLCTIIHLIYWRRRWSASLLLNLTPTDAWQFLLIKTCLETIQI